MLRKENSKLNEVGFRLASCVGVHAIFLAHERGWERLRECPTTVDLSTRLWKITTQFVGFIPRSLVLRSIIAELLIYLNWAIFVSKKWSLKSNLLCFLCAIRSLEIIQKLEHSYAVSNIFFQLTRVSLISFSAIKTIEGCLCSGFAITPVEEKGKNRFRILCSRTFNFCCLLSCFRVGGWYVLVDAGFSSKKWKIR